VITIKVNFKLIFLANMVILNTGDVWWITPSKTYPLWSTEKVIITMHGRCVLFAHSSSR